MSFTTGGPPPPAVFGVGGNEQLGFSIRDLFTIINAATEQVAEKLQAIRQDTTQVSIGDMFGLQMVMNQLPALNENVTAIVSAANQSIVSQCRNCKG